jgi:hypothetical protein
MTTLRQQSLFVQKLITLYLNPTRDMQPGLLSFTTELDSLFYIENNTTSDSCLVFDTLVSRQGNLGFYLGKCNTVSKEFPRCALFEIAISIQSHSSFECLPSLSDVNFSIGSPTSSSESVAFRR